jgi:hypothetical protein
MINFILKNPLLIFLIIISLLSLIYIIVRIVVFGVVKSFFQARRSHYQDLKNKLKKENKT